MQRIYTNRLLAFRHADRELSGRRLLRWRRTCGRRQRSQKERERELAGASATLMFVIMIVIVVVVMLLVAAGLFGEDKKVVENLLR